MRSLFKYLPDHLCKHNLTSEEYRAKWEYNRTTPLERLITRRKKRRNALEIELGSLAPRDAHEKALKARRGHGLPYRPERRLVGTEAADDEVLTLARSGLSIPEIAAKVGMATPTVHKRIKRLQERG
jgi:DNA-directed RNA polymerase specialized sigma24 family protein